MKELLSIAANYLATFSAEGVNPQVEVILILSEPTYSLDATGAQIRSRETITTRFITSAPQLRKVAKILVEFADEAEIKLAKAKEAK